MIKLFERIFWHNNTNPALNETNLNAMSKAIDDIDDRVIELADTIMEDVPLVKELLEDAQEIVDETAQYAEDSEAWSQGTRNGVPVDSTDPTYHNNSKWHSEHLQTDIGNLNDVEITDPEDGQGIIYDAEAQKWKNGTADIGLFVQNGILMCRYETE